MIFRAIWGFFLRDTHTQLSYRLGFVMDLVSVFFSAATFYFVAQLFSQSSIPALAQYGGDYYSFVIIGIAFSSYQNVGLTSFSQSIRQEQYLGTLEPIMMTPIRIPSFLVGSALWDFFYASLEVVLYGLFGVLLFKADISQAHWGAAFLVLFLTVVAFMGIGVLSAAFILRYKKGNPITWFMATLSELLGGVYFPIAVLPDWLKTLSSFVPMTHALEGLRKSLLLGQGVEEVLPQIMALFAFSVLIWPLGLFVFHTFLKKAKKEGNLGNY